MAITRCDRPQSGGWIGKGAIASLATLVMLLGESQLQIAKAQIQGDDTLPAGRRTQVVPLPNGEDVEIQGGLERGRNLVHSFQQFNVNDGQRVTFIDGGFENILSRVTGQDASDILGTLAVDGNANLFLMNPNGITFGPNAQLELNGSFIATTADELQFGRRGSFTAGVEVPGGNLTIAPTAFVFNQLDNGTPPIADRSIRVETQFQNPETFAGGLSVAEGRSILLSGGAIDIAGGVLRAPRGRLEMIALASEGEIAIEQNRAGNQYRLNLLEILEESGDLEFANIGISDGAVLDVTGNGRGRNRGDITVFGQDLDISGRSSVCAGIGVAFACMRDREDLVNAPPIGDASSEAGNIVFLLNGEFTLRQRSRVVNNVNLNATGNAGFDDVRETISRVVNRESNFQESLDAFFGSVFILSESVTLQGLDTIEGIDTVGISVNTFGNGNAGLIQLNATESIQIIGARTDASDGLLSVISSSIESGATGDAGGILIGTNSFEMSDFSAISTSTFGEGNPGTVWIFADDPTTPAINDGRVALENNAVIFSNVESGGVADDVAIDPAGRDIDEGAIFIESGSVSISGGSQLQTLVRNFGQGDAGNIIVTADTVEIDGGFVAEDGRRFSSSIFSSVDVNAVGDGGFIFINAGNLSVTNGGSIDANTSSSTGGTDLDGNGTTDSRGGSIVALVSGDLLLRDGSLITTSALSRTGQAGLIILVADGRYVLREGSAIAAVSRSGRGGNVFIEGSNFLLLAEGSDVSTQAGIDEAGGGGNGGNIILAVGAAIIGSPANDNNINAQAFDGNGGSIFIPGLVSLQDIAERSDDFITSNDITVSSQFGADGLLFFNELDVDPARGLFELPELVVDLDRLLVQACPGPGRQTPGELGALYVTGRGGLPPSPGDRPGDETVLADWVALSETEETVARGEAASETAEASEAVPTVEAQEIVRDANGDVWLVADGGVGLPAPPPQPSVCPE